MEELKEVEFFANVKRVQMKNLVSGDKEVVIELRIVGADIVFANRLADLPIDQQVKVVFKE